MESWMPYSHFISKLLPRVFRRDVIDVYLIAVLKGYRMKPSTFRAAMES